MCSLKLLNIVNFKIYKRKLAVIIRFYVFIQNSFIAGSGCIISKFLFSAVSFLNALICCCNFLLSSRITKTSDICNSRYSDESVLGITFFYISTITHRYELSILRIRIHMDFLISGLKLLATSIKSSMST